MKSRTLELTNFRHNARFKVLKETLKENKYRDRVESCPETKCNQMLTSHFAGFTIRKPKNKATLQSLLFHRKKREMELSPPPERA